VYWEGNQVATLNSSTPGFATYEFSLQATITGEARLEFRAGDNNGGGGLLDNISVTLPTTETQPTVTGFADTAISLNIHAALADTDGSETLSVHIGGVPQYATLSAGTHNDDGTWTLSKADLSGLTLTPATGFSGTINLDVTATATESNASVASTHLNLIVNVTEHSTTVDRSRTRQSIPAPETCHCRLRTSLGMPTARSIYSKPPSTPHPGPKAPVPSPCRLRKWSMRVPRY
jgi:hypothetical protein